MFAGFPEGLLNQVLAQLAVLAEGGAVDLIAPEPADYHGRDLSTVTAQDVRCAANELTSVVPSLNLRFYWEFDGSARG